MTALSKQFIERLVAVSEERKAAHSTRPVDSKAVARQLDPKVLRRKVERSFFELVFSDGTRAYTWGRGENHKAWSIGWGVNRGIKSIMKSLDVKDNSR